MYVVGASFMAAVS